VPSAVLGASLSAVLDVVLSVALVAGVALKKGWERGLVCPTSRVKYLPPQYKPLHLFQ
jgi:hypothetical protein